MRRLEPKRESGSANFHDCLVSATERALGGVEDSAESSARAVDPLSPGRIPGIDGFLQAPHKEVLAAAGDSATVELGAQIVALSFVEAFVVEAEQAGDRIEREDGRDPRAELFRVAWLAFGNTANVALVSMMQRAKQLIFKASGRGSGKAEEKSGDGGGGGGGGSGGGSSGGGGGDAGGDDSGGGDAAGGASGLIECKDCPSTDSPAWMSWCMSRCPCRVSDRACHGLCCCALDWPDPRFPTRRDLAQCRNPFTQRRFRQ